MTDELRLRTAFILGGAQCVFEDAKNALGPDFRVQEGDGVIAVNDIGVDWRGPLVAWCSLHGDQLMQRWLPARLKLGLDMPARTFTGLDSGDQDNIRAALTDCVEAKFEGQEHGGSSGLFAVKVAIRDLGYDRAVLLGMPMTDQPHYFASDSDKPIVDKPDGWSQATSFWVGWQEAMPHLNGRVFSMSGYTRQLLGAPTWIINHEQEEEQGEEQHEE